MADEQIVTSIVAKADLSSLVSEVHRASASLQQLQRELLASNKAISSSTKLANNLFRDTLTGSGQFSSHFVNLNSDVDKFGKNLDAGRLKLKNYFSTFREHTTTQKGMIRELAREQVMLQNSVLQPLGRNAQGLMQYNVMIPRGLDAVANSGKLARMEMQIMNRALSEGAGSLINWGKNTQWAGRQLTVGLTVPLTMFGAAAGKAFKEADQELVRLTKVYGGLAATSASDLKAIREEVVETAKTLSKTMGASFKDTIALGADIAATGQTGNELLGSIAETTRLAILGEVDRQDAMKATLSIQTAFKQNTQELTESINFLNAVENQTSTTLNDLVEAIPKAGPVIQQLGGDVKDLALYLTAMREGGISASEGANALKSGLASLINPTKQTVGMMSDFGIDVMGMVAKNTGDTTGLLMDLQKALDSLDPLSKARAMEQMFGKFQFARMSALLNNLGKQGSQTLQVLDLMKASTAELAEVASRELKMVTESASGKYKRAIEGLKAELADVGEEFLGVATKLIGAATKILDFFTKLPDPIKKGLTFLAGFTALVGPLIMLTGLLANFFGYITKGVVQLRAFFMKANGWKMLTPEIIAAEKAALLVENAFYSDAAAAQVLHNALQKLVLDYQNLQAASMKNAVPVNGGVSTVAGAPVMIGGRRVVDPNDPYVGDPNTRAMSHINPRDPNKPATIFGGVPGAIPVNRGISRTPQMYMHDRLPNIEGLTSVKGISTGIVPGEAAKFHALMATLGMQTEQEVAALKKTIMMGGTVSRELLDTFDDILPITQRFADSAATQSGLIVQQMRSAEITVDQAKARILALNAQIESEMGSAVGLYAAGRGRTLDLTRAPMMDQPVVDANGQFTLRDLYKKKTNAAVMTEFGRLRGIRTFGAPYSMQTTRMPKFNTGGEVESFGPNKTVVSGPSSIGYDDRLGSVPLGGYVLNQAASMDPANAALVAMAPSTYLNNGGSITAALTPREVVFGPQIQRMPELYAAVDAANSGYNFGGQIMNGISGYGKENPKGINKAEFKRQMREYLAFIHNPRYEDDIRVRMIMLDAAELTGSAGIPINKAIKIATSNFDLAKSRSGGSLEKFIELRVKQVKGLENAKGPNGKLKYPGLKLQNSSDTRHPQSTALNSHLNAVKASMLGDKSFSGVTDLIQRITPTSGLTLGKHPVPRLEGNVRAHLIRNGNIVDDAGNPYGTRGHMGVAAVMPQSINSVMNTLQNIGISPDILSLTSADARKNLEIALKNVGLSDFATVDDIFTALQDDGLFKSKSQIESGKVVRANRKQNSALSMLVEAAASRKKWFVMGRPPLLMLRNKGGVIPGGSISAGRSSYGVVPPLSARLEAIRLAQQARYAEKREADMIKYPWIKEAVAGRDRGSNISPLLKLLAPGKQLDILEQAREMSKATATGSFKDLPPVKYGHMVAPSSGMSFPIPGVSGLYKDSEGRLKFFKGVPNEISAKAEVYGTRMAREVFGLDAPEQTIKTILNPLDPSGKTKLLGVESPFDKKFAGGGTVFTEDEMIRQTIASLVMNNKDLSPSNVYGNVLADVGAAGVFPKASRNTEFAKTLPSMGEQAMINLLGVKGGARKDFAVNTSHLAGSMTAKQYERKMKAAMKKIHPKLIKFVATLPREDRAPYIKLLQRFEDGMEQTDFKTLHGVHVAAKRNSGGPIGGGSIQRGRYSYGAKNKKGSQTSGNPAKRAEEKRLRVERTASYNASSGSGYTSSGNPQMQVIQVPYVGGSGVPGNAFGAVATAQSQQTIDILRLAQIGQLPAAVSRSFKSLTDSIKLGTVGLRYGIATSGTHINTAYRDFAKQQVSSARLNAAFLSNWVKTNTRDIKDGILRNQARSTFAAYPGANYLMGPGQIMPVSMSGPGMVGDWQDTGQDGTKSRKVGTFGYRKREYMGPDGYIHDKKSAQAAGLDTKIRGGMGMGAQMGIGMAGNMGGMYLMQQEKVNMLGMEMSGMNAGLGLMAASTIIPMLPWKTIGHSIKTVTTNTMAAIKAGKGFKDGISAVGAQLGKYIKILKGVGVVLSVALIGFDGWKKYNNAQQDAAMSLGITKDGADQAGISYFNLNSYLTEYIEKQKLANAAAQGGKNSSIGMPGIPQSVEDMKKAKEEGAALKDLIESINRTSSTGELQNLVNNQKAQFIAGGLSVEQANRMIYGALANSEKATKSYQLLADEGFGAITDKATAAEFAVKNLLQALKPDSTTGMSKGSFWGNFMKEPMNYWDSERPWYENIYKNSALGIIDRTSNAIADTNAYKKGVISGLESVISTFDASTKALVGTKNETGEVIDEYEAYQISLEKLEKSMPDFNVALGEETFKIIQDMSPELAEITNKFDSIKSILAKIKLSTSGIGLDLKYLDGALAIKLAGFQAAVDDGIEGLTKAAGDGSTFGSVGSVLKKLQKSIAATSAASQKAAAATQKNIQEELKLIAKKISLIEDEKNKKLESLRATQDASNYALELQKLQIEYADAVSRGDQAGAARARLDIDQLTKNRQLALTQKAIEDEAARLKAIEQKKIDAKQAAADAAAASYQGSVDNASSASKIADVIQGFKDTYDDITTARITNSVLPDSEAKREAESALLLRLNELLKQIGVAGTGKSQTAEEIRKAFSDYFNKDGTVKKLYIERAGLPEVTSKGPVPTTVTTLNKDTLSIFDRDIAAVTKFADQITGGSGYSIKKMTQEIVAALKRSVNAPASTKDVLGSDILLPLLKPSDYEKLKAYAERRGYKSGQKFTLENSNGVIQKFVVNPNGSVTYEGVSKTGPVYASGGEVRGPGTGTSDSIPAMLSHGEYVVKASSVAKYGVRTLDAINTQKFHKGGPVHAHLLDGTHPPSEISLGDNRYVSVYPTGTVWKPRPDLDRKDYKTEKEWLAAYYPKVRTDIFLTPPTKDYGIDKIKSPMGSLQRFLDIARSQIGAGHSYRLHTRDNPTAAKGNTPGMDDGMSDVNKFTIWGKKKFGLPSDVSWWCGEFVAWVAEKAGVEISDKMHSAWQATQQYKKQGLFNDLNKKNNYKNIKVGDLAWFDYARIPEDGGVGRRDGVPDHASIVSRVGKDVVDVIGWFGDDAVKQIGYYLKDPDLYGSVRPEFKKPAPKVITDTTPLSTATTPNQSSDTSTALSPTPTPAPTGFAQGGLAALPRLKKKIFESFPKKKYPTRNPGGMGIDKSTPPLIGSGASAWFGGLLGGGGGFTVGMHDGGYVHPHPHNSFTNTLIQAPPKGTTAYAKYAYEMAKHYGGAAKTAAKLTKPIKVSDGPAYSWLGSDGTVGYSRHDKYKYVDAGMGSAKQVESQILSDLSKTAMRAKIVEMNAKRFHLGGSVHTHPHDAFLPRLKKKIFESFPKKKYPTRNPGGMGIDKSTPPLIGSGASAWFGGLLGGGGGFTVGMHDGGYVHPHPHNSFTNTLIQAPPKGTTAYAKYAYEMAKHYGGAAKTAAKLTKPIKVSDGPAYSWLGSDGTVGYSRHDKYKYVDAGMGSAKQVESQILSDLSKTAMRAKIVEMNAKRFHKGGLAEKGHRHGNENGNFFSRFNPVNAFSAMLSGMFNVGASKTFNTNTNIQSQVTQQEKDYMALQTSQLISGYTSAFNLKNNTSPEIFGSKKLGTGLDVLGVIPGLGAIRSLSKSASQTKAAQSLLPSIIKSRRAEFEVANPTSDFVPEEPFIGPLGRFESEWDFRYPWTPVGDPSDLVKPSLFSKLKPPIPQPIQNELRVLTNMKKTLGSLWSSGPSKNPLRWGGTLDSWDRQRLFSEILNNPIGNLGLKYNPKIKASSIIDDKYNQAEALRGTDEHLEFMNANNPYNSFSTLQKLMAPPSGQGWHNNLQYKNIYKNILNKIKKPITNQITRLSEKVRSSVLEPLKLADRAVTLKYKDFLGNKNLFEKIIPEKLYTSLYRNTPLGGFIARSTAKNNAMRPSLPDTDKSLSLSIKDLSKEDFYHGGLIPDDTVVSRVPAGEDANFGSLFNYDFFSTKNNVMSREYAVGKNSDGDIIADIYKMQWGKLDPAKTWDLRPGKPSLWSQNKKAYIALEKALAEKDGIQSARKVLAGERIPGIAHSRSNFDDRAQAFQHMQLDSLFTVNKKGVVQRLIDTIIHTGGHNIGSGGLHTVITSMSPAERISEFKKVLTGSDLSMAAPKGIQLSNDQIKSILERVIHQKMTMGKILPVLAEGHLNVNKFADGGYVNSLSNLGLPMFEDGINMVPANMLAMLHKDEAVIPANMNPFNPNASAAVSGSVYNINVELNGTNVTAQDVATQIHKEMRLKEMAAGVNRRVGNG